MRRLNGRFIATTMMILIAGMLLALPTFAADGSDLSGRIENWVKAYNSGDDAGLAALYTENAVRMPYQAPSITGRAAIIENLQKARDAGVVKVKLMVSGAETQAKLGWGHGTYALIDSEGTIIEKGKWMNVSKKVGADWLFHSDIWNTDAPE